VSCAGTTKRKEAAMYLYVMCKKDETEEMA